MVKAWRYATKRWAFVFISTIEGKDGVCSFVYCIWIKYRSSDCDSRWLEATLLFISKYNRTFFLPDDPQELNDLSTIHVDKVSELKSLLLKECGGNLRNGVNKAG